MTEQNENQQTETTEQISSPQSESSEGTGLEFEEPDFGAITDFVEGVDEIETLDAAEAEPAEEPVEETPPEEPPESVASESEETPEVAEEPAEPEAEVEAEAEEKPAEETPPEPEPEPVKFPTREELEGLYAEHREKTLPELEKVFTLTDEEAAALDEQPSTVLPKLASTLMYDTMLSTYNAVLTALPSVVTTLLQANSAADQAQNKFMERWPDLKEKRAEPAVRAAIQAYRSANPRASVDDVIQNAGVMAMINLGLDPTKKAEATAPKPKPKAAPPKPVAPTGQTPVPPKPPGSQEENVFSELAELFQQEMG